MHTRGVIRYNSKCIWGKIIACDYDTRAQNKDFKMSGHDGQPFLNLVGHLHQLLGHANETADNWLQSCQYTELLEGQNKEATN